MQRSCQLVIASIAFTAATRLLRGPVRALMSSLIPSPLPYLALNRSRSYTSVNLDRGYQSGSV
ncbi:hypothetical protein P152DRAFT_461221 [Eremomyces bilateralis CBS 781.70]|uniref:Uncharacterized protein n=1 Tax=Eremomyces bilateralis CBS 781.70 TaxID=1392243 RepID=A0A6G1FVI0_9PEZI|nr:uncharacterized protein P152DRAFT_461221 [Eremomyces bilateralis CBS 781.70]KAF1809827.1 hypothetical protein P152DRAFT_461221 [Eremomyces bilateralis CBS 781.70]